MTTVTGKVSANGAAGLTGYTRAIVTCVMDGTATGATFTIPNTFIFKAFVPSTVGLKDGKPYAVTMTESSGTYTATIGGSAPSADTYEIILIGELGRRDFAPRTSVNYTSENPNYAGNP